MKIQFHLIMLYLITLSTSGFSQSQKSVERKRIDVWISDTDSSTFYGQLLNYGKDTLWLYLSDSAYSNHVTKNQVAAFPAKRINRIRLNRKSQLKNGALSGGMISLVPAVSVGAMFLASDEPGWAVLAAPAVFIGSAMILVPAGGLIGNMYRIDIDIQLQGDLEKYKALRDQIHHLAIVEQYSGSSNPNPISNSNQLEQYRPKKFDPLSYSRFHVGFYRKHTFSSMESDLSNAMNFSLQNWRHSYTDKYPGPGFYLGFSVNPTTRFETFLHTESYFISYYKNNNESYNYTYIDLNYDLSSFSAGLAYTYKPTARIRARKHEFSFGGGATFYSISNGYNYSTQTENDYDYSYAYFNPKITYGAYAYAQFDVFPSRYLSAFLRISGNYAAPVNMSHIDLNKTNDPDLTKIYSFQFNPTNVGIAVGASLHLF